MDKENPNWHLSKSIPLTLVVAIGVQTFALVWYVSNLDSSIKANSKEILRNESRLDNLEKTVHYQAVTLGRMDENIKAIRDTLEKMSSE